MKLVSTTDDPLEVPFLKSDNTAERTGARIVAELGARLGGDWLNPETFALVLAVPGQHGQARGFAHNGNWRCYPCSLVKTFHLVHALAALDAGLVEPHAELDRAMEAMIKWSSNTATNYVIDILTGTTGDTLLAPAEFAAWVARRERLNGFFRDLGWREFSVCNLTQKLMDDTRFGREAQFAGPGGNNLNALVPLAAARLMWEIWDDRLPLSAQSQARAQNILARHADSADAANPNYQLSEYLGGGLPSGVSIWSKAGHNQWTGDAATSWYKHDMIRLVEPSRAPLTMVLMTKGRQIAAERPDTFPTAGRIIWDMAAEL